MTQPQTNAHAQGSNPGAVKILLSLVLGSMLLGGAWGLMGPGNRLIGTWQIHEGHAFDAFRFDADGSYWRRSGGGILSINLTGTYRIVKTKGDTFQVLIETEFGDIDQKYRLVSPDQLLELDPDAPDDQTYHSRTGDWVLAVRPSASASSYDGAKPHLGCWQRSSSSSHTMELLENGTALHRADGETESSSYTVDYSKVPFQLDVTDAEGEVARGIFELTVGGGLRASFANGERPKEMNRYQDFIPCPAADSQGDS